MKESVCDRERVCEREREREGEGERERVKQWVKRGRSKKEPQYR
jgi:hypothetical protein